METYTFAQFPYPYSTVHLALFQNIQNAAEIRQKLISAATMPGDEGEAARKEVEFGFIEASMLASKEHLMAAIVSTLLLALPGGSSTPITRTHNLHSEILLNLWTNNIISDAIKKFGISNSTRYLLVVRFGQGGEQKEIWEAIDRVVQGELIPLRKLDEEGIADWKQLDKVYKLSDLNKLALPPAEIRAKKMAAVVSSVAMKSVA